MLDPKLDLNARSETGVWEHVRQGDKVIVLGIFCLAEVIKENKGKHGVPPSLHRYLSRPGTSLADSVHGYWLQVNGLYHRALLTWNFNRRHVQRLQTSALIGLHGMGLIPQHTQHHTLVSGRKEGVSFLRETFFAKSLLPAVTLQQRSPFRCI